MYEKTYGNKYDGSLSIVEICKRIRQDLKEEVKINQLFAGATFSVRKRSHSSLVVEVKSLGFNPLNPVRIKEDLETNWRGREPWNTPDGEKFLVRLHDIANAYNFDGSEIQSDYFNVNYYLDTRLDYDMRESFVAALSENLEEEVRKYEQAQFDALPVCTCCGEKTEYQYEIDGVTGLCWNCYYPLFKIEEDKKNETFKVEHAAHMETLKKIEVVELEDKHEFTRILQPRLNKQCTISDYNAEREAGDYDEVRALIVEKATLTTEQYDIFAENLLENVPWLKGKGGCDSTATFPGCEDMSFFDLSAEQQEHYKAGVYTIVIEVTAQGRETVFVDPQGYSYARYLGFAAQPRPRQSSNIYSLAEYRDNRSSTFIN